MRNEGITRIEAKGMIRAAVAPIDAMARNTKAAAGNAAFASGLTLSNPGAAPSSFIYAAILLTAKVTGVFEFGWDVPFNSGTTGDSITMATKTVGWSAANWAGISQTGKIALTGGTFEGVLGASSGAAVNGGSAPGCYIATVGGTAITATITGANSTTTTATSRAVPTLTGLLTAQGMQWDSGSVQVQQGTAIGVNAPFAIGSPVLVEFVISATNTISMTGSASFWAGECGSN